MDSCLRMVNARLREDHPQPSVSIDGAGPVRLPGALPEGALSFQGISAGNPGALAEGPQGLHGVSAGILRYTLQLHD